MFDLDQYLEEQLKDPEFKKIHEENQEEYEAIRAEIAARCSQNVTQEELARRTGIRQSNISRIESGACSPRISTLQKIADALGMKLCIELRKKSS